MKIVNLGLDVYVIIGGMFPRCNSIVILGEENVVIDPGCKIEDLRLFLTNKNLELRNIDAIILTHIHPDHIMHATRIQRLSRCRIVTNEITAPLFNDKEEMKRFLGFHPAHPVRALWEKFVDEKMYGALDEGKVDEVLHDEDKLTIGELTLRCVYTPGHTPDHMCIEFQELNTIFSSDIDCTEFGPFYGHPNSSIPIFRKSIELLKKRQYDFLVSGHLKNPVVENYIAALIAFDRQFDIREDIVMASILNGATTVSEIVETPIIYPSLTNPVFLQFEKWMIEHHVKQLVEKEYVIESDGRLKPA